ncbi:hypothetical protein THOM_1536 [Trachipleistophora hominis]|uniref:Uncharacterized protein n=1 Tax=Trachipleistophora hominis TaxID=72359 RepID=L7JWQ4_TRAHO|nr:hypothetical protein THOM_1536 [Trachipleistophora hominis]
MQTMPQGSTVDFNATYCHNNTNQEQVVFEHVPCANLMPGFPPTTNQWKRKINYNFSYPSPSKQVKTESSRSEILIALLNQSDEDLNPYVPSNKDNPSTSNDEEEASSQPAPLPTNNT